MITLSLLLCLTSNPTDCHSEDIAFEGSILQCAMFGQAAAASYMQDQPKWALRRYRCGMHQTRA